MKTQNKNLEAIDLLIENLQTPHSEIRVLSKKLQCDQELIVWQDFVLEYLQNIRHTLNGQSKL
jgi:hypothetical protein